jgi:hypothetical protein
MKLLYTTIVAFVVACSMIYLAVVFSWDYFSTGASHYVALVVGSPFVLLSHFYPDLTTPAMVLAFLIYFVVAFILVVGCQKMARRLRRIRSAEQA